MKNIILNFIAVSCLTFSTFASFSNNLLPEWHQAKGVIIVWQGHESYCSELIKRIHPDNTCFLVIDSNSQANQVQQEVNGYWDYVGNIEHFIFPYDDCWVVDYSPIFVQNNNELHLIDFQYFRSADDTFPEYLSSIWDIPIRGMPLSFEGGNFMTDGYGTCFVTDEIIDQNIGFSAEEIKNVLRKYLGCHTVCILEKLEDGTGHIDMFAKVINPETILIGEYKPDEHEYEILENNVSILSSMKNFNGEKFRIIRVPMPGYPLDYWTYTNSLILNHQVFVPVYSCPEDHIALEIYQNNMPGFEIIGIDCRGIIQSGGAIHCITKTVPKF